MEKYVWRVSAEFGLNGLKECYSRQALQQVLDYLGIMDYNGPGLYSVPYSTYSNWVNISFAIRRD